ncbi:hypothetical protein MPUL_24160 [Mycolicibacterium pulveris]|uniref:Uncharacterized protein n=1 Tax=Mycolicibacterium pulveris TaxID=36813 RepID=A0A7I7UIF6_MYCPV|nr:hypothetical protein MPUL_24160 [Mycolicibacterium pulveris]
MLQLPDGAAQRRLGHVQPIGSAAVEAVAICASVLVGVVSAMAAVVVITRGLCNRIRSAQWQHALDSLVDHGDGQPRRQP